MLPRDILTTPAAAAGQSWAGCGVMRGLNAASTTTQHTSGETWCFAWHADTQLDMFVLN